MRNPVKSTSIMPHILETCTPVEEALEVLQFSSIIFSTLLGQVMFHVLVADAAGNTAIVEFMDKTRVITKEKDYLLMTNFYASDPAIPWNNHVEGCGIYDLDNLAMRLYVRNDFTSPRDFHLPEELQKWNNSYCMEQSIPYISPTASSTIRANFPKSRAFSL